ncbi:MAG TPA: hypothetical protein VK493_04680, partial [Bryobacteraceae bacterium]|nr:hypothetical protein [Bryobacteraceae bacterium]
SFGRRPLDEIDIHQSATVEIDPVFRAAFYPQTNQTGYRQNQRQQDERPLPAEKVKIRLLENFHLARGAGIY